MVGLVQGGWVPGEGVAPQGGAELEKPAGLEQSVQIGLHSSAWGLSASLTPTLRPRGAGTRRASLDLTRGFGLETSGEGESAWALSWG